MKKRSPLAIPLGPHAWRKALVTAALMAALLIADGAIAEDFVDPAFLYEVVDVANGQALPLRQQPDPMGEVVGELAADRDDVILSGAVIHASGADWYEVVRDDGPAGWAEARNLRAREDAAAQGYALQCSGTEPFWSLSIERETAQFSTPDIEEVRWSASEWLPARGLSGRFMIRLEADQTGYLAVMRARQHCSDGMSEINHPFEALLITPAQAVRAGCCRRRR